MHLLCLDSVPSFLGLFDLGIAPPLLFYTYIPVVVLTICIGFFALIKDNYSLVSRLLFAVSLSFTLWVVNIFIAWIGAYVSMVMLSWALTPLLESLIFLLSVYFVYVFIGDEKKDIPFRIKLILFLACVPILIALPTSTNITRFDLSICEGTPSHVWYFYMYAMEFVAILWILFIGTRKYLSLEKKDDNRKKISFFLVGIVSFLALFVASNVAGQLTGKQEISFIGSLGLVVFIGSLSYLIVQYKVFNIKLFAAQALVITLAVLVGSQFFFIQNNTNKILTGITLILTAVFGWILINSVDKEVKRKEELQQISDSLAKANARLRELDNTKTEFISIASHQLRTPLTAIKGYLSLLLEGSYGAVSAEVMDVLEKVNLVNKNLIQLVEDLLNVSRIDAGRIKYSFEPTQLETLAAERVDMFMPIARDRGIELGLRLPKKALPKMMIDPGKMREAISNLVDNSIKYTEKGSVIVSIGPVRDEAVRILVEDTGIGFREEDGAKLFGKFVRTQETTKVYVSGTGLGLFVGKSFVEAHGGRMWAESDGLGKGSRFYIELPVVNPKAPMESGSGEEGEK